MKTLHSVCAVCVEGGCSYEDSTQCVCCMCGGRLQL